MPDYIRSGKIPSSRARILEGRQMAEECPHSSVSERNFPAVLPAENS